MDKKEKRNDKVFHYKKISDCIINVKTKTIIGDVNQFIYSIEYDSRKIKKISNYEVAFFALSGIHIDGKKFINAAIQNGACCIFYEGELYNFVEGVCYIQVENIRSVMAKVSANFYDTPSKKLGVIGVTGTEGKSSTVSFIFQLLNSLGEKAGFFSTVEYSTGDKIISNPEHQTTPESNIVQKRLFQMEKNNCKYAVVEASSHGLSDLTARLQDVVFDVGVFINVTQEHLEFHKTLEQYRYDKANLFRALDKPQSQKKILCINKKIIPFGIVNYEDKNASYFINATKHLVFPFSTDQKQFKKIKELKGFFAKDIKETENGIEFTICDFNSCGLDSNSSTSNLTNNEYDARINLNGLFNVQNILAAVICVHKMTGIDMKNIVEKLSQIKSVKGRMQQVNEGQDFEVIIDYAHTPSSFLTIFSAVKNRKKEQDCKIISVFGSGGERDLQKRPEQGRVASEYSDFIILADEDPRGEDSTELLQMIAVGCKNKKLNKDLFIIPDRPSAIKKAFSLARKNDIVLLLGKGHENSIIYKNTVMPYDEEKTARELLYKMS